MEAFPINIDVVGGVLAPVVGAWVILSLTGGYKRNHLYSADRERADHVNPASLVNVFPPRDVSRPPFRSDDRRLTLRAA